MVWQGMVRYCAIALNSVQGAGLAALAGNKEGARIVATLAACFQKTGPEGVHFGYDRAWSRPALNRSWGKSMPMKTILLSLASPVAHLGPTSLPMSW